MTLPASYDHLASAWETGAGRVYRPLAHALVASSPVPLQGRRVLDAGCGTGMVAAAAAGAGASVTALDRSLGMLRTVSGAGPRITGDVTALPLRPASFDAVLAGFVVNHLPATQALASLAQVVRPGGAVLATTWAKGPDEVKTAFDAVAVARGWVRPEWYLEMKNELDPVSGSPDLLAAAAADAGLVDVTAVSRHCDLGFLRAENAVAYRMAVPHVAPWVATLASRERSALVEQATSAVAPFVDGWRPAVVFLAAFTSR
ncbi:MAG TPA: class I SAM-dependent methyltransferase [Acidimicrobiales bacterium]|nr:class I SAM-dependent methyltransferase [Acidimicrobiales bacterium]